MIFRTNLSMLKIGLMMYGRARWQEAEATIKYFNTVLTRQDKKFFTFFDPSLQNKKYIPKIFLRVQFIILDVQSIYTLSQIQG